MGCSSTTVKANVRLNHSEATTKTLDEQFKGAMRGSHIEEISFEKLKALGFTDANTLFSESTCPDEINHDDPLEDITAIF